MVYLAIVLFALTAFDGFDGKYGLNILLCSMH